MEWFFQSRMSNCPCSPTLTLGKYTLIPRICLKYISFSIESLVQLLLLRSSFFLQLHSSSQNSSPPPPLSLSLYIYIYKNIYPTAKEEKEIGWRC